MKRRLSGMFVLFGGASYGLLASFVNLGYREGYTVGEITGSQMFFGALFLWMVAFLRRGTWQRVQWKTVVKLMLAGTLNGLTGVLYYSSMQRIPASIAIVMLFQFVWVGMLYGWLFDRQKPTKSMWLSLPIILVGTLLAAGVIGGEFQAWSPWGLFLGFISAFTFAGFVYVSGRVATEISPWARSPIMVTGAMVFIFILFPPQFLVSGVLPQGLWKFTFPLALLGAVIPTVSFTIGAPHLRSGMATILSSIELPVAVLMAWIVLKEAVHWPQWLGILLILCAIVVSEWHALHTHETERIAHK